MEDKIKLLDPQVQKLIRTYLAVFGELPTAASCDKLVQVDLKLRPEFVGHEIRRRPYPAPKEQADEIERQIQECIDAGLVLQYRDRDCPQHCSPCFLLVKPGSTAKRLVVDYGELNKKTLVHANCTPFWKRRTQKTTARKTILFGHLQHTQNPMTMVGYTTPCTEGKTPGEAR